MAKLTEGKLKKLRKILAQNILDRYDNMEYWDTDLIDNTLQDWGIADEHDDEVYERLSKKEVKITIKK
jgi:hypothetical protein